MLTVHITFLTDFDLRSISDICVSLTYLSIKGCTLVSDAGISSLICKCLKLTSIVACYTLFGQQSIIALCSPNASCDDVVEEDTGKRSNLQMLHIGGCKGALFISHVMSFIRQLL